MWHSWNETDFMTLQPHQSASLRTAMEMGLIEPIVMSPEPKTATQLASITKCNKQLIGIPILSNVQIIPSLTSERSTNPPTALCVEDYQRSRLRNICRYLYDQNPHHPIRWWRLQIHVRPSRNIGHSHADLPVPNIFPEP